MWAQRELCDEIIVRRPTSSVGAGKFKVESGQNPFHSSHSIAVKGM